MNIGEWFLAAKNVLIGRARNLSDKSLFQQTSLIALFAWVGLGADGLSSSCYGPESAFVALQTHTFLSLFVAAATMLTIIVICTSYSQIIEAFPDGRRRLPGRQQIAVADGGRGVRLRLDWRLCADHRHQCGQRRGRAVQLVAGGIGMHVETAVFRRRALFFLRC